MQPALLRRHTERGAYDLAAAQAVFDDCLLAHVAYVDEAGLPACMPMIAVMGEGLEDEETDAPAVYLHGHPSAKLMELVRRAAASPDGPPVKVCITATRVDGLVLSSAPNGHTFNYRAATVHGTCAPVGGRAAKTAVLRAVTDKIVAGRWAEVHPVASRQVALVYVVRVRIDRLSVKARAGTAGIQPRDAAVDGPDREPAPWTGVVPLWEQLGAPVASGRTPGSAVSAGLRRFLDERNAAQAAAARARAEPEV